MDRDVDIVGRQVAWAVVVRRALLGIAVLLTPGTVARAQTTMLLCDMDMGGSWPYTQDEPTTIDLNETQRTVTIRFAPTHIHGTAEPGYTEGPFTAAFSDNTISWSGTTEGANVTGIINRLTGIFTTGVGWRYACQAGQRRF